MRVCPPPSKGLRVGALAQPACNFEQLPIRSGAQQDSPPAPGLGPQQKLATSTPHAQAQAGSPQKFDLPNDVAYFASCTKSGVASERSQNSGPLGGPGGWL